MGSKDAPHDYHARPAVEKRRVGASSLKGIEHAGTQGEDQMAVRRIVANIAAADPARGRAFYETLLGLKLVMDHGWIKTFASDGSAAPQISFASQGGSDTPVPDLSIEVDDVDDVHRRAIAGGFEISYGITDEPWGVRRFFVRDPFGRLVNILSH